MKSLHLFALLLLVVTVASYGIGGSGDSGEDRYNKGDISVLPSVDEIDRRYNVKKAPIKPPRRDRRVNHGRRRNGPRRGRKMGKKARNGPVNIVKQLEKSLRRGGGLFRNF